MLQSGCDRNGVVMPALRSRPCFSEFVLLPSRGTDWLFISKTLNRKLDNTSTKRSLVLKAEVNKFRFLIWTCSSDEQVLIWRYSVVEWRPPQSQSLKPERMKVWRLGCPWRNISDISRQREDCGQVLDHRRTLGIRNIYMTGQFSWRRRTFADVWEILLMDLGVMLEQVQGEEGLVAHSAGQPWLSGWTTEKWLEFYL